MDFQAHADTVFQLDDGLTIVCGTSNAGKTALLRAIDFVMSNEVPNSEFVRWDCDNATVKIRFTDGIIVERVKGKRNDVFVHYPKGHPDTPEKSSTFEARNFGVTYPPQVLKALGYPPNTERLGSVWYAAQHEKPFIVGMKPVDLPRAISEITDLSNLEEAAKRLSTKAKQLSTQSKDAQKAADKAEAELKPFTTLERRLTEHAAIEKAFDDIEERFRLVSKANKLFSDWEAIEGEHGRLTAELKTCDAILALTEPASGLAKRMQKVIAAHSLWNRVSETEQEVLELTDEIEDLDAILNNVSGAEVNALSTRLQKVQEAILLHKEWTSINTLGRQTKLEMDEAEVDRIKHERELNAYRDRMVAEGKVCGVCGQVVTK